MAASSGDTAIAEVYGDAVQTDTDVAATQPLEVELSSLKLLDSEDSPDSDSVEGIGKGKSGSASAVAARYPYRAGEPDCTYYVKFGVCRFGMKCKFNHPSRKKKGKGKGNGKFGDASASLASNEEQGMNFSEDLFDSKGSVDDKGEDNTTEVEKQTKTEFAEKRSDDKKKEPKIKKEKGKEFFSEATGQTECKYFSMPGGCKFGKACKYIHRDENTGKVENEPVELNFLGFPLRPGEKECPYYMRTGSCKYSNNCKFHHPDPGSVGSRELTPDHQNCVAPQNSIQSIPSVASQVHVPLWPDQRMLNEHVPFLAGIVPPQGMYLNPGWNGYQVPVNPYYAAPIHMQPYLSPPMNPARFAPDISVSHQEHADSYPERPGEPECQHYLKNGYCKFKLKCKYHHPKIRPSPSCDNLSPLGLPINPDQPICPFYGHYGVCKLGPACVYNHPFNYGAPVPPVGLPAGHFPSPASNAV